MGERADYLVEQLDGELRKRGYRRAQGSGGGLMPQIGASYRHKNGNVLRVEYKLPHLYRAEEFCGLVGDAILRFEKDMLPGRKNRLLLAVLLGRMSRKAEEDLRRYASRFLPGLQWFLIADDGHGMIHLEEKDESVEAVEPLRRHDQFSAGVNRVGLFSPKNQWLWKLLLMPGMDQRYWGGPQQKPGSVGELARVSHVSQPAVSSFVGRAEEAGFVRRVPKGLVVERHQELLDDWVYAIKQSRREELSLQFVYPEESEEQWLGKVRSFCQQSKKEVSAPPLVMGYHLACQILGFGRSNVRMPWLYSSKNPEEIMGALDLVKADEGHGRLSLVDPSSPESVFGGFIHVNGIPVCDALQCYLDVRLSRARGMEQADVIMDRVLRPHFEGRTLLR